MAWIPIHAEDNDYFFPLENLLDNQFPIRSTIASKERRVAMRAVSQVLGGLRAHCSQVQPWHHNNIQPWIGWWDQDMKSWIYWHGGVSGASRVYYLQSQFLRTSGVGSKLTSWNDGLATGGLLRVSRKERKGLIEPGS